MKFILTFMAVILLPLCLSAQTDSTMYKTMEVQTDAYVKAIETQSADVKINECDFMLSSCDDTSLRSHIAIRLYSHYLNSPIMGDESVAIHLAQNWFFTGKTSFKDELDLLNARIFVEFNSRSLIGKRALSLNLEDRDGRRHEALGKVADSLANGSSRCRVLFFYDSDCAKCRLESVMLSSVFRQDLYPVDFIAVYTGDDKSKWDEFVASHLNFETKSIRIFNYWDPTVDSDYQRKYAVLQTPRMFLIDKEGIIRGRNLDTPALVTLLDIYAAEKELEYGLPQSMEMFASIFPEKNRAFNADSIANMSRYIEKRTLQERKDTVAFRQLTGDFLYYLVSKKGEAFAFGSDYVADNMVLSRPDIWKSHDDSLKVVGLASMVNSMMDLCPIGGRLPDIKIPLLRLNHKGEKQVRTKLSKIPACSALIFHTKGCTDCAAEIEAAEKMAKSTKRRFYLIDTDILASDYPDSWQLLLENLDLSSLPFVIEIGERRKVISKYGTFVGKEN